MTQSQYPQLAMPIGVSNALDGDETEVAANAIPLWEPDEKNFYPGAISGGGGGEGTVISVGLEMPVEFSVDGTPVTDVGTFVVSKLPQAVHTVYAGPWGEVVEDIPTFRLLEPEDIPALAYVTSPGGGFTIGNIVRTADEDGQQIQQSGVVISDGNTLYRFGAQVELHTSTYYLMEQEDTGKVKEFDNSAEITVELPDPVDMPDGWCCTVMQIGTGQIAFAGTYVAFNGATKTAGQYAAASIWVNTDKTGYRIAGTLS